MRPRTSYINVAPAEKVDLQHGSPTSARTRPRSAGAVRCLNTRPRARRCNAHAREDPCRCFRRRQRSSPPRINEAVRMRACMSTLRVTLMIILFSPSQSRHLSCIFLFLPTTGSFLLARIHFVLSGLDLLRALCLAVLGAPCAAQ